MSPKTIAVGRIKAPNGLKGKMWITPLGESFNEYPQYQIGENGEVRKLVSFEKRRNGCVIRLEGFDNISQVEELKGQVLFIKRDWLPETGDDEFYWSDVIGMKVVDVSGRELGEIISIIPTGSNDVLVVDKIKQHLLPTTSNVIKTISVETNIMTVDISSLTDILDLS